MDRPRSRVASPDEDPVIAAVERVNRLRKEDQRLSATRRTALDEAEASIEERFAPSERLAVYGTLAPGEVNHTVVAALRGDWIAGEVRGELQPEGWGTTYGFPALRWRPGGRAVPVQVLVSPDLPDHWPRLDDFEGPGYRRILVPVYEPSEAPGPGALLTVANLYEGR